jgi:hypothetical protein
MTKFITLSMLAAILAASVSVSTASAEDRDRDRRMHEVCTTVTKCHREDGRRMCHKEQECKMVRDRR